MSRLTVANVTEDGRWVGPQARIANVAAQLRKKHEIDTVVICPKDNSDRLRGRLKNDGVACCPISLHHLTRHTPELVRYILFFVPEVFQLIRVLKKEQVDTVHCNGPWQFKGLLASRLLGLPTIWHLNDTRDNTILRLIVQVLGPVLATAFIATCHRTKSYYLDGTRAGRKPVYIVQAPVDVDTFDPDNWTPSETVHSYSGPKVVTVGSVNPEKGLETLVSAAGNLEEISSIDPHFFIVGAIYESQREYGERLRKTVEANNLNVHFLGYRDDVPKVLKAADLYVCSSKNESGPMAAWEALAMGVPVVSTDVGDVRKYITQEERCGHVVPVGDSQELATATADLLENEEKRSRFSRRAREVAVSRLSLDRCAERHVALYRDILRTA
jgi:glycosyltransferase involved in cell wall biosynthesis